MNEKAMVMGAGAWRPHGPLTERPLEVPADRLLQDWSEAHARALAYLEALGVPETEAEGLSMRAIARALAQVWEPESDAIAETLRALRRLLEETPGRADDEDAVFRAWRLTRALDGLAPGSDPRERPISAPADAASVCSMPPLSRRAMVSGPINRRFFRRFRPLERGKRAVAVPADRPLYGSRLRQLRRHFSWNWVAKRRRFLLGMLVSVPTLVASEFMVNVLPHRGETVLEVAIAILFGALFGWISIGFWTAVLGFWTLIHRDRFAITALDTPEGDPAAADAERSPVAIIMPICEEPVERVFAGLRAIHRSLERAGGLDRFHFFVLSDTVTAGAAMQEEEAWFRWCRAVDGFGRIFYRRRKVRIERKSGNVADFCRRWGRRYRYMVSLDADSVMSGETLLRMVELMDRHPGVGMIQTAPTCVNRRSLFARVQQFASRVYGPMFAAGLHFWQLGDGQYWGHNTIIRVAPFMDHCALPRLPGKEPLGGEILSHDFVEAALMGRAGWSLWLAYDLAGSWEETSSTLLDEMKRDRRWCQGNLQHLRLLFTEGLFGAHRALFLNGALSYMSALLWNAFLGLSTVAALVNALQPPEYFPHGASLFPEWPIWRPDWALYLMAVIGAILFLPKVLAIVLVVVKSRNARAYGGVGRLTLSVLLEILLSSLLAPIRMVFHTRFVLMNLLGRTVGWRSSGRDDTDTSWSEALRHHGLDTIVASAWGFLLYWLSPAYFFWVTPIVGALILSVPVSVYTSRTRVGDRARRWGLFLIPEESAPPAELRDMHAFAAESRQRAAALVRQERDGFVRVAVDPYLNALHRVLLGGARSVRSSIRAARRAILERVLRDGPASLSPRERRVLLRDPETTEELHRRVWALSDRSRAAQWGRPGRPGPPSP